MSPSKTNRRMSRLEISMWFVTVLIAVLCTPVKAKDTQVCCVAWLHLGSDSHYFRVGYKSNGYFAGHCPCVCITQLSFQLHLCLLLTKHNHDSTFHWLGAMDYALAILLKSLSQKYSFLSTHQPQVIFYFYLKVDFVALPLMNDSNH